MYQFKNCHELYKRVMGDTQCVSRSDHSTHTRYGLNLSSSYQIYSYFELVYNKCLGWWGPRGILILTYNMQLPQWNKVDLLFQTEIVLCVCVSGARYMSSVHDFEIFNLCHKVVSSIRSSCSLSTAPRTHQHPHEEGDLFPSLQLSIYLTSSYVHV